MGASRNDLLAFALALAAATLACNNAATPPAAKALADDADLLTGVIPSVAHDTRSRDSGELIVKLDEGVSLAASARTIRDAGGIGVRHSRYASHMLVRLDPGVTQEAALARLRADPSVVYAERNSYASTQDVTTLAAGTVFTPNDLLFSHQWHMKLLDAERAWAIQKGSPKVVVAVVDTGIAYEDFGPFRRAPDWGDTTFVPGRNVLDGTEHANDDHFHGTHVASTIGEGTNNRTGVAGLAFGCALMPVKALGADGFGTYFDIAEGIYYAFRDAPQKAQVINLSLGGDDDSVTLGTAIDQAVAAGVVVVAAAGNAGEPHVSFPARKPNVISVGAVDGRKVKTPYSNFGPELDLMAPGGDFERDDDHDGRPDGVLQQTFNPGTVAREGRYDDFGYFFVEGTSQATPHVSASAALLISQGITDPAAVKAALQATALDLGVPGRDDSYGYGLVQPVPALTGMGLDQ